MLYLSAFSADLPATLSLARRAGRRIVFLNSVWELRKQQKNPGHPVNPVCPVAPEDGTGV